MIGSIFSMFSAAGLITKLITVGALLVTLATIYGVWHHRVYTKGYNTAIADIARADSKAVANATQMRSVFKTCRDQGGKWDQVTGACK